MVVRGHYGIYITTRMSYVYRNTVGGVVNACGVLGVGVRLVLIGVMLASIFNRRVAVARTFQSVEADGQR